MAEIIFLHGWSMKSDVFIRQRRSVGGHNVVTPDLKGTFTGQIADLLSSRNEGKLFLAGWSMGVSMILSELESIQSLVTGLIFLSGTPCFVARENFPYGMRPAIARRLYRDLEKDFLPAWEGFTELLTHTETLDEETKKALKSVFAGVKNVLEPEQALADLNWLYQGDYRNKLKDINIPLMIISGSQDRICFPEASRYMSERVPGSALHIINDTGHMPFFTRHGEVNRLIRDFADGH